MHIQGPAHLHGAQPVGAPHSSRPSKPAAPLQSGPIEDELQISDAARLVEAARQLPEIRQEKVDEIRTKIAQGTYETDEKLDIAIGRLMDEIG